MKQLNFVGLPQIAISEGATSPNPGYAGVQVWSTTLSAMMFWNGTSWSRFKYYPYVSDTEPDPNIHPIWYTTAGEQFVWDGEIYWPVCDRIVLCGNIYGAAGSTLPSGQDIEMCPENDEIGSPDQPIQRTALEDNVWQQTTTSGADAWFGGRYINYVNNKVNMGAGGEIAYTNGVRYNRVPIAYQGPYGFSARPVVT